MKIGLIWRCGVRAYFAVASHFFPGTSRYIVAASVACSLAISDYAHAVTTTNWNTDSSGNFTTPANWDNGVPDSDDTAVFDRGFVAYEVNFPGGSIIDPPLTYNIENLRVRTNEVSFVHNAVLVQSIPSLSVVNPDTEIIIGEDAGNVAILNMALSSLSGGNASIGRAPSADGTLNVSGTFSMSGYLKVGENGRGTMNVTAGGSVASDIGYIGELSGSNGTANIDGAGSDWALANVLFVGGNGTGALTIEAGGSVSSLGGILGLDNGSNGTATVTGAGSTWTNGSSVLIVGLRGTVMLNINSGSAVSNTAGLIGRNSNASGTVTVNGSGSTWTNSSSLTVGMSGHGTLNIQNGGRVSTTSAFIARQSNSTGTATVSGAGSNWSIDGQLSVGGSLGVSGGTGKLIIQPGGSVDVAQDIALFPNGQVRLEGGTLTAQSIGFQGGGQFQWTSGALHVDVYNGSLTNFSGKLAPGRSPGSTTITGNYTQQPSAVLEIEIGGKLVAAEHDFVGVTGTAILGGQLDLALIEGFVPNAADTFTIFTSGSLLSFFSNVINGQRLATVDGLGSFLVHYGPSSISIPTKSD